MSSKDNSSRDRSQAMVGAKPVPSRKGCQKNLRLSLAVGAHRRGARFPKYSYTISGEYDIFKCEGFTLRSARERGVRVSPRSACVILPLNPLTIHPPYEVC